MDYFHTVMDFLKSDFSIQMFANAIGTVIGGFTLFFILEKRLHEIDKQSQIKRLFRNLYGELITDLVIVQRIIENKYQTLTTDVFNVARLKTRSISDFIYQRPVEDRNDFYNRLTSTVTNFEMINNLVELVFTSTTPKAVIGNKKTIISKTPKLVSDINKLLLDIAEYDKKYDFNQENHEDKKPTDN